MLPAGELREQDGHQTQVPKLVAFAVGENLPPGQSVHADEPDTFLYLPAAQPLQNMPSGPVNPAKHVQFKSDVLPAGAVVH